ncbi:uncharacterized protein BDZ83DRAFT_649318 [Colletotrichum acutatum]|uniref:Uncharacterized protein n=1 Tax=Glomerella acutata TaxID=27357 RepID=A0AAD8XJC2_GLOAC|nr:uncharacterized protein BDZ83DRAFT_649318 [Colletotrichum acutatum]KAK1727708.1 hypothetical protein BDZ83DRAFT_649318 [Colletotrichum acutatum]
MTCLALSCSKTRSPSHDKEPLAMTVRVPVRVLITYNPRSHPGGQVGECRSSLTIQSEAIGRDSRCGQTKVQAAAFPKALVRQGGLVGNFPNSFGRRMTEVSIFSIPIPHHPSIPRTTTHHRAPRTTQTQEEKSQASLSLSQRPNGPTLAELCVTAPSSRPQKIHRALYLTRRSAGHTDRPYLP